MHGRLQVGNVFHTLPEWESQDKGSNNPSSHEPGGGRRKDDVSVRFALVAVASPGLVRGHKSTRKLFVSYT